MDFNSLLSFSIPLTSGWVKYDDDDKPIWTTFQVEEPENIEDWHQVEVTL